MSNKKVVVVIGPTASGKSDFAVEYALKNNGEIISCDSRQLYKGLDIGTGKITEEEMKGIRHHMLSVYELGEDVSVVRFVRDASPIIEDILKRNKTPILCGGTGQYIDALIFDTTIPKVEPNKKLREELEKKSKEELYAELLKKDKYRAENIDKDNKVRLIRALEIVEKLGSVPKQSINLGTKYDAEFYIMSPNRKVLKERITKRLEKRLKMGMVDEVKNIIDKGFEVKDMKRFGLEYVAIAKFLKGEINEDTMKQEIITKSCQYAKRQDTWNRKYSKSIKCKVHKVES